MKKFRFRAVFTATLLLSSATLLGQGGPEEYDSGAVDMIIVPRIISQGELGEDLIEIARSVVVQRLEKKKYSVEETGTPGMFENITISDLERPEETWIKSLLSEQGNWIALVALSRGRDFLFVEGVDPRFSGGISIPSTKEFIANPVIADFLKATFLLLDASKGRVMWKAEEVYVPVERGRPVLNPSFTESDVTDLVVKVVDRLP